MTISVAGVDYYGWRNRYAPVPVLVAQLQLKDGAEWICDPPPDAAAALTARLAGLPPVLAKADLARLVAETAQQLQFEADVTTRCCGVAARDGAAATIFFAARDYYTAGVALSASVQIAGALARPRPDPGAFARLLEHCATAVCETGFDISSRQMIEAAAARGIPWYRHSNNRRHICLGQGVRTEMSRETVTSRQSALGRELVRDKFQQFRVLARLGLPMGRYGSAEDKAGALKTGATIGYPLVLKPTFGRKGKNVHLNLQGPAELAAAFDIAAAHDKAFVLQSLFTGEDYRLLVVDGRMIAAARFKAAAVTGDGTSSIRQLVAGENRDPRRGHGFYKLMNVITLDDDFTRAIARQGFKPDDVPPPGRRVTVKGNANLSVGGTSVDVTALVHPDNAVLAVRAARALDIDVAGIDFITPDIARSWREAGGGICEVNIFPGLRLHYVADPACDAAGAIIETLFPRGDDGRIPTVLVAGPGAAAAADMAGGLLAAAGHLAGVESGGRSRIGDETIAGLRDASPVPLVLRDGGVTAAVLEIDIASLDKGIALDRCDVVALMPGAALSPEARAALLAAARKAVLLPAGEAVPAGNVTTIHYASGAPAEVAAAIAAALGIEQKHP